MAAKKTRSRSSGSGRSDSRSSGRSASQKGGKYRFAQNVGEERTVAEREYLDYALSDHREMGDDPDVLLDVPVVKVDSIHLELENLNAHVALKTRVLDLVKLDVGVDAHLGKLRLDIKGVEAQALLKVRLDHVAAIVDRVLTTIDRNPELVKSLGEAVEEIGSGAGHTLGETGEAVEEVGQGAEGAVQDVGQGAGQAVGEVGQGAGQAVGQVGQGAGQAVGDVGQGLGQTVGNVDQAVGGLGQAAGQLGHEAGLLGQQGSGPQSGGGGDQQSADGGDPTAAAGAASGTQVAKEAAKTVVKELGSAASQEAKELGVAATRKARELGERRRQRRAESYNATPAAIRTAEELGVDLEELDGTGAEGRITVADVRGAENA